MYKLESDNPFHPNNPIMKISQVYHSIKRKDYDKKLLDTIPDVDLQTYNGTTLLTGAVCKRNVELVNSLIENYKANVDGRNYDFTTPLHSAIRASDLDMTRFLLSKNADPQAYAPEPDVFNSPIVYAFELGNDYIIEVLLENIKKTSPEDINDLYELSIEFNKQHLFGEL